MTILITGATDGIGFALARHYSRLNRPFLALGRRPYTSLTSAPFDAAHYLEVDLALPGSDYAVTRALNALNIASLDLVIHNAGTGYYGPIQDQPEADIERLIEINFTTPLELTRALSGRIEKAGGAFVFIGSVAASIPSPHYAVYAATKQAIDGFARNLRLEAKGRFRVQVIHPGAVRTGLHQKMGIPKETLDWESFPSADHIAARIAKAIERGRPRTTIGVGNALLASAARQCPSLFDRLYGRRFQ